MKSVILFNQRELTYAVVGINYTDDEANHEVDRLRGEGGFHVDQKGKRYSSDRELEARMEEITKGKVTRVNL